jgi:hypothetical protein
MMKQILSHETSAQTEDAYMRFVYGLKWAVAAALILIITAGQLSAQGGSAGK